MKAVEVWYDKKNTKLQLKLQKKIQNTWKSWTNIIINTKNGDLLEVWINFLIEIMNECEAIQEKLKRFKNVLTFCPLISMGQKRKENLT